MAMSDAERARRYRERRGAIPRGPLQPHGTVAAARRHQRAGESLKKRDTVCRECTEALADHQAKMYRNRKNRRERNSGA